ncbi:MAG TPA: tyrosine--tRNA ligase [Thermomicrobiales bacterium]|nr:tyrosine--tRNA ligase [Thermomicrobiales bacterium]
MSAMIQGAVDDRSIPKTPGGRISAPEYARAEGMNPIDYLRQRGYIHDIVDEEGLKAEFEKGPLTYYIGFDPTGPSLHAGHMATIMLLATLQRFGHRPIALAGGGTAMVGDPTGRTSAREMIRIEELDANVSGISVQLARYLDFEGGRFGGNPAALLLNNADWLLKLEYIPFLRDIGRHFSVNEMLSTETYRNRLEEGGLNFVEFNYRLVQGYDYLHLYRSENCRLQLGGSDQWSNILGGVDLIRRADGGKVYAVVSPLITTLTGEKMGKTGTGLRVWLNPDMFSPYDYYQYWVNTDDAMVETYLKRFTFIRNEEIEDLTSVQGEALREAKRVLAFEATAMAHGVEEAEKAESATRSLFSGGTPSAGDTDLPTTQIARTEVDGELTLADAFVRAGLAKGRGEARRLAQQGGLSVDDEKVSDVDVVFGDILGERNAVLLRAGKKRFKRVAIV